ncbi:XRE family transcriptional regulator [Ciceribacter sp. L1K22]|uniref:XRE family transcriptional regulator n=1 Tax=Ciceribacter sp. L1K22 TaxID=2820275 RepID=UPI001FEF6C8D|nr:XRE family transcriptional regulator [Ciceribacter sp. L1K22]
MRCWRGRRLCIGQAERSAGRCKHRRPRTNDLLRGKLAKFSLDALVNIAAAAHLQIEIKVRDAA